MSSKLEYLKRYGKSKKKKLIGAKKSNFCVVDDDVDWKSSALEAESMFKCDEDPEEAPIVTEVRDESEIKWQPLSTLEGDDNEGTDMTCAKDVIMDSPRNQKIPGQNQDKYHGPTVIARKAHSKLNSSLKERKPDTKAVEKFAETIYRNAGKDALDVPKVDKEADEKFMQWGRGYANQL